LKIPKLNKSGSDNILLTSFRLPDELANEFADRNPDRARFRGRLVKQLGAKAKPTRLADSRSTLLSDLIHSLNVTPPLLFSFLFQQASLYDSRCFSFTPLARRLRDRVEK
jgi:hypothetical protein